MEPGLGAVSAVLPWMDPSTTLVSMLFVQGLLSTILVALACGAYLQRRTRPYLFLLIAAMTLMVESIAGVIGIVIPMDPLVHLLLDHLLDITLIVAVLGAIYSARELNAPHQSSHERV